MLANPIFSSDYTFPLFSLLLVTIYLVLKAKSADTMIFNTGDVCVFIYCLFILVNIIIYNPYKTTLTEILFPVVYLQLFITLRLILNNNSNRKNILFVVFLLVLVENFFGWLQIFNITESLNKNFHVTGSFISPALFTNFIIIGTPAILWLYNNETNKAKKITYLFTMASSILICFFTDSKLSWLTVAMIAFIYFLFRYKNKVVSKKKILYFFFPTAIATIAILILFQDSTSGRFFVFKNSVYLLGLSWFRGIGIGNFDYYYNLTQANYLKLHSSVYFPNATYIETAYNEPLQFFIEGGILSFMLIVFSMFVMYTYKQWFRKNIEITLGLLAFLIISLFSFPFRTSSSCILFMVYLSIFFSGMGKGMFVSRYRSIIVAIVMTANIITIAGIFIIQSKLIKWRTLEQHELQLSDKETMLVYEDLLGTFGNDKDFLLGFANNRFQYQDFDTAIQILERASLRSNKLDIFLSLGTFYEKIGNYRKAEENYSKCKYLDPSIVRPRYELMKLYLRQKRLEEAIVVAQDIMNTPAKIKSKQSSDIRKFARQIINIKPL